MNEVNEIKNRLEELPKGTLIYKNINGKKQPYLQSTVNGKSVSYYIKLDGREEILLQIEEREQLKKRLSRLSRYSEEIIKILRDNPYLDKEITIGSQDFYNIIDANKFYVDKTEFIYEWWNSHDPVTLITRPRRFGKTLMLSTVSHFFSIYDEGTDRFENLAVYNHPSMKLLRHAYPVINISFADLKGDSFADMTEQLRYVFAKAFDEHKHILNDDRLTGFSYLINSYENNFNSLSKVGLINVISDLSRALEEYHGRKAIILLDEYDTPLQDAYLNGFYDEMVDFMRRFFVVTFKTNSHYERALITGITKISKSSMFSDANNIVSASLIDDRCATYFGFTEEEVRDTLTCLSSDEMATVKAFYDGFTIGSHRDIYNPWSIIHYLKNGKTLCYWANTASSNLISELVISSGEEVKREFAELLSGGSITKAIDDNIAFEYLDSSSDALWMLLFNTGYLKADNVRVEDMMPVGELSLTNRESRAVFEQMVKRWFDESRSNYNEFIRAMLAGDVNEINRAINEAISLLRASRCL